MKYLWNKKLKQNITKSLKKIYTICFSTTEVVLQRFHSHLTFFFYSMHTRDYFAWNLKEILEFTWMISKISSLPSPSLKNQHDRKKRMMGNKHEIIFSVI